MSAALDLLDGLIIEGGSAWGAVSTDWQRADAAALLDTSPDVRKLTAWTRPRGGSKTSDGAACGIVALVEQLAPSSRGYVFAVDADQAALFVEAAAGLIDRSELSGLLEVQTRRIVNRVTGAAIVVMAADSASAYGLRSPWFWCDEFTNWPPSHRALWTAVFSAVPKVPGCRLTVVGTAGDPAWWTEREVLDAARASSDWRVSDVPGPLPWISAEALAQQRDVLTDWDYARLHLNQRAAANNRLVSAEHLAAANVLDGPQDPEPGVKYRVGCDIGLRHDRTAIAVAHSERVDSGRSRIVLDRMVVFKGTREHEVVLDDVEHALYEIWRTYGRPQIRMDPWQAIGLAQRLRARGISVEEWSYTPKRYAEAAQALFTLLRDGRLALYPDDALFDELANVRLKEVAPGLVRVDHDAGRHDDMAQALGFAVVPLVERGVSKARTVSFADVSISDANVSPLRRRRGITIDDAARGGPLAAIVARVNREAKALEDQEQQP